MKTDKQKRKADEANLGSEPPSEDSRRRKRKRPSRQKRKGIIVQQVSFVCLNKL